MPNAYLVVTVPDLLSQGSRDDKTATGQLQHNFLGEIPGRILNGIESPAGASAILKRRDNRSANLWLGWVVFMARVWRTHSVDTFATRAAR